MDKMDELIAIQQEVNDIVSQALDVRLPRRWITVVPIVSMGRRRIGRLAELSVEPGFSLARGAEVRVHGLRYHITASGYEGQSAVVHLVPAC